MNEKQWWRTSGWVAARYVLAVVLGVGVVGVALWQVPWWIDAHYLNDNLEQPVATTVTGVRTSLLAIGAGAVAATGVLYTHRTLRHTQERDRKHDETARERDRTQFEIAREGQVTDRYTKAISQIASDKPVEQLGGIYALKRIMHDSGKDYVTVVEVLAAFVREHTSTLADHSPHERLQLARRRLRTGNPPALGERTAAHNVRPRPTEPVQAALTVLARRPRDQDQDRMENFRINLSNTDLRGADLRNAILMGADLSRARLEGASLSRANLRGAVLAEACFEGTYLTEACLEGAYLEEADLAEARELSVDQLVSARLRRSTKLPARLTEDNAVKQRIKVVEAEEGTRESS